jgi:hypothetical protein
MSPTVFSVGGQEIVAAGGKEGVIYLLDAQHIGGPDHKTPLYRSPLLANEDADFAGRGFWGAFATAEDEQSKRWLYAPAEGAAASGVKFPATNGEAPNGSIMAFRVTETDGKFEAAPAWISRDMNLPEPPIVAGGLVFAISNGEFARQSKGTEGGLYSSAERIAKHVGHAVLYAFDMTTGKELYSSGERDDAGLDSLQRDFDFGGEGVCDDLRFECVRVWGEGAIGQESPIQSAITVASCRACAMSMVEGI